MVICARLVMAGCDKKTDMPEDRPSPAPDTSMLYRDNERGIVINLPEKGLFATGQDKIGPGAKQTLEKTRNLIVYFNAAPVMIYGYTDNQDRPAANLTLPEKRATAVKNYLVSDLGLDAARIREVKGMGETQPMAPNDTPDGQQQNRRVEVIIKTNS